MVQAALGAVVVLVTSTLNRVMVVEYALPALLPGVLVALHYAVQLIRPRFGYGSDRGGRRTPWIIGGMAVLGGGGVLCSIATVLLHAHAGLGLALAIVGYAMVGIGVGGRRHIAAGADGKARGRPASGGRRHHHVDIDDRRLRRDLRGGGPFSGSVLAAALDSGHRRGGRRCLLDRARGGVERRARRSAPAARMPRRAPRTATGRSPTPCAGCGAIRRRAPSRCSCSFRCSPTAPRSCCSSRSAGWYSATPWESRPGSPDPGMAAALIGMIGVGLLCSGRRRFGSLRQWTVGGCCASAAALSCLGFASIVGPGWPLRLSVLALGVSNGVFAVSAIGSMMELAHDGRIGQRRRAHGAVGRRSGRRFRLRRGSRHRHRRFVPLAVRFADGRVCRRLLRRGRLVPGGRRFGGQGSLGLSHFVSNFIGGDRMNDSIETFDVVVVGGGPSGATAATDLARHGSTVCLLDRAGRIKPCGGAIPPKLIEEFEIPDSLLVAKIKSARMISPKQVAVDMPIEGGFVGMVNRETFDDWLRQRARSAGADLRLGTFERITRDAEGMAVVHYRVRLGRAPGACAGRHRRRRRALGRRQAMRAGGGSDSLRGGLSRDHPRAADRERSVCRHPLRCVLPGPIVPGFLCVDISPRRDRQRRRGQRSQGFFAARRNDGTARARESLRRRDDSPRGRAHSHEAVAALGQRPRRGACRRRRRRGGARIGRRHLLCDGGRPICRRRRGSIARDGRCARAARRRGGSS